MESIVLTVKTSCNACSFQRLISSILFPRRHQTRHLILGKGNLSAAEGSERKIRDLELRSRCRHDCGVSEVGEVVFLCCGVGLVECSRGSVCTSTGRENQRPDILQIN